ncbi:hypothetical protein U0070_019849 [Myodes glareolus]|uniref:Dickkopf-related protein 1 n=1 Tax=Myodes glareolus TaxID=447135 RepID=A0AAW0HQR2_MYOGA
MTVVCAVAAVRFWVLLAAMAFCSLPLLGVSATLNSVLINSNAIKNLPPPLGGAAGQPGSAVSVAPGVLYEGGNKYQTLDNYQPYPCAEDEECGTEEYCSSPSRGGAGVGIQICLACRKRRKRCMRHSMCCPGNYCKNGQEGSLCLRSSDCAMGLCCARHFWSKICKPVLKEGQVCTKHRRKGSHGLEIFQRCYCGEGLSCRIQKEHHQASNSSRLHTCQRH